MEIFLVILISYLLGNFQTSYLLGKIFMKSDIREFGSGNAGTTNALRVYGIKFAVATLVLDALKGAIAVVIGVYFLGEIGGYLSGVSVVLGHNWPAFLKFKGGKGIATTIGVALTISPLVAIICIILGVLIIIKTRYVSLGTITAIVIWPLLSFILMILKVVNLNFNFIIFSSILAIIAVYKHKTNINRLLKGEESKIGSKV